jgi:signal transduction histidine kinase
MIPLRTTHVVFYALVVTVTVTLVMSLGFWFIRQQMLTGNDFLLDTESEEILPRVMHIKPPIDAEKLEAALHEDTENDEQLYYFQVHTPEGKILYRSANLGTNSLLDLTGGINKRTVELPPFGILRMAEYDLPSAHVQIAMSLRNFQSVSNSFILVFLLGVPVIALLSVTFGLALRNSTLRPVRLMQAAARRISASNLGERIPIQSESGEMAALAGLLNEMIDRLEKSFNHAKRFTADVSHELMTPLAVIRLHAEKLLDDPDLPAKYHHSIEEQLQETLHLAQTLEHLLTLAKADSNVLPLKPESVSCAEFMGQFAEDAQLLAESRKLKVIMAQNDDTTATFDQGWIRQVLFNLLSNALRFSPPNGTVTFYSKCAEGIWTVEVWDEGPGVSPANLSEIFKRFVQITPRSEPGSGAGLGLAICKSIVELHKGNMTAGNRTDRSGLIVTFSMPAAGLKN